VPITVVATAPGPAAIDALRREIELAKGSDLLAPVTVVVPTNAAGVMTRRALGRLGGIAAVDMVTLYRLAELLGSPPLLAAGRSPVSTPVVDLAIRRVLVDVVGSWGEVADHPSSVVAVRELYRELRLAGPDARAALRRHSQRGRDAVDIVERTAGILRRSWYDEADLLAEATATASGALPRQLARTIMFLPQQARPLDLAFLRALGSGGDLRVVAALTGDTAADADIVAFTTNLDPAFVPPAAPAPRLPEISIVTTTDADDEVRLAARAVLDAARRRGTPFERIAVLWPTERPYARLVEHHFDAAAIPWNGRPGTRLGERVVPRLVVDLLGLDRRGLRRRDVFALLADLPARGRDGDHLPVATWERISRDAGVARDDDWTVRLDAWARREDDRGTDRGDHARELAAFVADLRATLGLADSSRRWREWSDWCVEQIDRWIGRRTLELLPEPERAAWEHTVRVLDRLRHLDGVSEPVTRAGFRSTFVAEFDVAPGRQGRVGDGVTVGALTGAAGLDIDELVVLGCVEGLLPAPPDPDPLLAESDRLAAGLPRAAAHADRQLRQLRSMLVTARRITLSAPRGDLRATTHHELSRWVRPYAEARPIVDLASHTAALSAAEFPVSPSEHRLRGLAVHVRAGGTLGDESPGAHDCVLRRALRLRAGRDADAVTEYDGDLSGAGVPPLGGPVSPTRLEAWVSCPHAYFVQFVLGVRRVEEPGEEVRITALDRGSAMHDALDRFHRAVLDGTLPQPGPSGWSDEHLDALAAIFDEVGAEVEHSGRSGRPASWAIERAAMRADLLEWMRRDASVVGSRGTQVLSSEQRFGDDGSITVALGGGRVLALQGSIDRVDVGPTGELYVVDHKTGGLRNYQGLGADDPTLGGARLQLPAYAAAAAAIAGRADALVHAEYSFFDKGRYERVGYTFTPEVWTRVGGELAAVVAGIESGLYPNRPERPGWVPFTACHFCDPDGLGTAERWAEWERKRHDPRLSSWFGEADEADEDRRG
jgi:RecB family exonuclease